MLFAASYILSTINIQGSNLQKLQRRISVLGFFELVLCALSVTIKSSVLVSYIYTVPHCELKQCFHTTERTEMILVITLVLIVDTTEIAFIKLTASGDRSLDLSK